jgi:putative serine protease PepD
MKNVIKVAILTSIITAALVYVVLEWRPLRSEVSQAPEVSWASTAARESNPAASAPAGADLSLDEKNNIDIYQRYGNGVVNITTTTLAYDFFLRPVPTESGTGSGAVIDDQGHIVTNFHVVRDAQRLEVTLPDKTKQTAQLVGADPNNDLAVIRISAPNVRLTPIPLGTSQGLQVGQKVIAIGNPYGLERTLTTGIISSLGRSIQAENGRVIEGIIQTDAAINPGNSGGPLLNSAGEIIGINTAILSPSSGSIGIGFAIPADTVRRITKDLITLGYVPHAYLGIAYSLALQDVPWLARALRLDAENGLLVVSIQPNSAASAGGIRGASERVRVGNYIVPAGGDVIIAFQGRPVNSAQEMASEIDRHKPGDRVTVTVLRDNRKIDLPIVLQEAPKR